MKSHSRTSSKSASGLKGSVSGSISSLVKRYETHFSELAQTFTHLGVLLIAFVIVLILFMWKDGMMSPSEKPFMPQANSVRDLSEIPPADVGIRMLLDQAQGEAGISSREAFLGEEKASSEASLQSVQKLDLKGPWTCMSGSSKGKAEVYVKNKQIRSTFTTESGLQNTLIIGDCMYEWSNGRGVKQCGIGQYIDMIESFVESGMLDLQSVLQSQLGDSPDSAGAYSVLQSCKKGNVVDAVFAMPQGVTWTETETNMPNGSSLMDMFGGL